MANDNRDFRQARSGPLSVWASESDIANRKRMDRFFWTITGFVGASPFVVVVCV